MTRKRSSFPIFFGKDTQPAYADASLVARINPADLTSWADGSQINDLSGKGNHVTQATSGAQPNMLVGAIQGQPAGHFDTTDWLTFGKNQLGNTKLFADSTDAFTVFAVGRWQNYGALIARASATSGTRNFQLYRNTASPYAIIGTCRGSNTTLVASTSNNCVYALAARWDGTTLKYYVMAEGASTWTEVAGVVGSGAEETAQNILLGARTDGAGNQLFGQLGEVLIYDTDLPDSKMAAIGKYYADNWVNRPVAGRIIILGASIEYQSFDASVFGEMLTSRLINATYGKYVPVFSKAVSGAYIADLDTNVNTYLSGFSVESYPTYCPIHIGGNDVSDQRPFSGSTSGELSAFTSGLASIIGKVETAGFTPILTDISFRNYGGTTIKNESAGSLPYNTQLVRPLMDADFLRADGTPLIELYDAFKNNYTTWLEGDNVHPNATGEAGWRQQMCDTLGRYICTGEMGESIAAFNPNNMSAPLQLWYDAMDSITFDTGTGTVDALVDKSTNGKNATSVADASYSATGMNSLPAISFDGTDDRYTISGISGADGLEVFAVWKVTDTAASRSLFGGSSGAATIAASSSGGVMRFSKQGVTVLVGTATAVPTATPLIVYGRAKVNDDYISFDDGATLVSATATTDPAFTSNITQIGSSNASALNKGLLSELLIFKHGLATDERTEIIDYLKDKWAI